MLRLIPILFAAALLQAADSRISFNRDIRPIMADTCFRCHGPDKSSRMANLRLDLREEALKPTRRGDVPIVPGDPDKSLIIQRIFADNAARLRPPASAHKPLTGEQKRKVRQWVQEGAVYEGHWAYQPVRRRRGESDRRLRANPPRHDRALALAASRQTHAVAARDV